MFFLRQVFIFACIFLVFSKILYASTSFLQETCLVKKKFKNNNNRSSYALGILLGNYINHSFNEQKKLGVILDKEKILIGIKDSLLGNSILSEKEVFRELTELDKELKCSEEESIKKKIYDNKIKGELYVKNILMQKKFKCTSSGLVFFIKKKGNGNLLKNSDFITVHYKGSLIDGSEFDNSYKNGKPLSFFLDSVIPGWQEGLKHIRKGGKIKLIIPPKLAYGEVGVPGILGGSTLIFEIELIDVKSK